MIVAWTLVIVLSAADGGLPLPEPEPRGDCKPPGSWDPKTQQCKPGCGIPLRWENGKQVGGCGRDEDSLEPLEHKKSPPKP